jgi:hypothetical protein
MFDFKGTKLVTVDDSVPGYTQYTNHQHTSADLYRQSAYPIMSLPPNNMVCLFDGEDWPDMMIRRFSSSCSLQAIGRWLLSSDVAVTGRSSKVIYMDMPISSRAC